MGKGRFEDGEVADGLLLRVDSVVHGLIEPAREMTIDEFQAAIAATRDRWNIIDEDPQS